MASNSIQQVGSIKVGDTVQIKDGGRDVTNGYTAKAGKLYGEGGPRWGKVVGIYENWNTGSRWGLPAQVTKVRICGDDGKTIVWQVQPQDVAGQVISDPAPSTPAAPPAPPVPPTPRPALLSERYDEIVIEEVQIPASASPFSPDGDSTKWYEGNKSNSLGSSSETPGYRNKAVISDSMFDGSAQNQSPQYITITGGNGSKLWDSSAIRSFMLKMGYSSSEVNQMLSSAKKRGASKASILGSPLMRAEYVNSWSSAGRRKELLNGDASRIQNQYKFPFISTKYNEKSITSAKYDYRFIPGDSRLPKDSPIKDLETRLMNARAAFGIPVHGNNDIAKSMKMYMYNRFKTPDLNLAHNKSVTHIFFTRPDLNILENANKAALQVMNHTDTALLFRTHPELFKLLTSYKRCGDSNNFNMLLSNQVTSFSLDDEKISTIRGGRSWAEHEMMYGEQYTGRTAGEFSCNFNETSDYSIISLMKLWITYIDNVGRGAWVPWYPHSFGPNGNEIISIEPGSQANENCHIFERALDYAASVYIFKCAADGEEVLYWSKYYGVFPTVTGSSALSWDLNNPIGDGPKLNINFAYSFKKDLSPISLLEFNHVANANEDMAWVPSYDTELGHCTRPYVGAPYIEIDLGNPNMNVDDVNKTNKRTQIRLKFRKDESPARTDQMLFKANYKS